MKGSIFIPDMTGFTHFVNNIDSELGVSIIQDLLNEIIQSNPLNIELSEIEGDAILYYKEGNPICLHEMFEGFKKISEAFDSRYRYLKELHNINLDLSLKFIVHHGNFNVYHISGFRQLYGEVVIESHRLLKNGANSTNYILITEDYLNALNETASDFILKEKGFSYLCSDFFTGLRKVGYYFFNLFPNNFYENSLIRA